MAMSTSAWGPGGTFRPGPKPDHLNVGAEDMSGQMSDLFCDLSRSSHESLVEHAPSVAVLTMMSTGLGRSADVGPARLSPLRLV